MATKKAIRPSRKLAGKSKKSPPKKATRKTVKQVSNTRTLKIRRAYKGGGAGVIHEVSMASASDVRKTLGIDRKTIKAVAQALAN